MRLRHSTTFLSSLFLLVAPTTLALPQPQPSEHELTLRRDDMRASTPIVQDSADDLASVRLFLFSPYYFCLFFFFGRWKVVEGDVWGVQDRC
jgi:hypothetical protein